MSDERYVHDPDAFREGDADSEDTAARGRVDREADGGASAVDGAAVTHSQPAGELSGRAGWAVVAALVCLFVVVPVAVYLRPPTFLGFQDAYLAAAMLPALALGAVGVWTALR